MFKSVGVSQNLNEKAEFTNGIAERMAPVKTFTVTSPQDDSLP